MKVLYNQLRFLKELKCHNSMVLVAHTIQSESFVKEINFKPPHLHNRD